MADVGKEFDDIKLKLDAIDDLPDGAGPIIFHKDFGDTAALMLTVASPKVDATEIALRAEHAAARDRRGSGVRGTGRRGPRGHRARACRTSVNAERCAARRSTRSPAGGDSATASCRDIRRLDGPGFVGIDATTDGDDAALSDYVQAFVRERLHAVRAPSRRLAARRRPRSGRDGRASSPPSPATSTATASSTTSPT